MRLSLGKLHTPKNNYFHKLCMYELVAIVTDVSVCTITESTTACYDIGQ